MGRLFVVVDRTDENGAARGCECSADELKGSQCVEDNSLILLASWPAGLGYEK
jgi:hypothetical protein